MIYSRIIHNIKQRSNATLKAWTYQCESILAQRSRRIQQLFTFYHRVYGTHGLKQLIKAYHRHLPPFKGKNFVLCTIGLMGVSVTGGRGKGGGVGQHFDWNRERLSLGNFDKCQKDIEFIETLPKNKLCNQCQAKSMKYCYCLIGNKDLGRKSGSKSITINPMYKPDNKTDHGGSHSTGSVDGARVMGQKLIDLDNTRPWEPYLSKDHYSIWKREESNAMYSYKVYAYFKDISAADFLHIQTDIKYRKEWDETAVVLKLIEEDPIPGNNSHLIYWEMQWPKLFTNRDYVYCRRFISDEKRKLIMIASRATKHPAYPEKPGKVRVKNYWSLMVIKPYRNFHEPGLHYVLTYFDDPGIAIPQSIKSWITQKQMPDFLQKMYKATKDYSYKRAKAMKAVFNSFTKLDHEYTANAHREHWLKRLWCNGSRTSNNTENDVNIANHNNNNSNNSNNNNNNSNNNNTNNNNSNTNNNSIANNSNNTNNNNTSNSNSNSSININTNNSKIRRLNSE